MNKYLMGALLVVIIGLGSFWFVTSTKESEGTAQPPVEIGFDREDDPEINDPDGLVGLVQDGYHPMKMSFEHTAPGQYSHVYVSMVALPGDEVTVILDGPSIEPPTKQVKTADQEGNVQFSFKVFQYGVYSATASITGEITLYSEYVKVE